MVAVGTLRMMDGAELGNLEMAIATAGSPSVEGSIASPAGRSGAFHYRCAGNATVATFDLPLALTAGGTAIDNTQGLADDHILFGYAFRTSDKTPAAAFRDIAEIEDESAVGRLCRVRLQSDSGLTFGATSGSLYTEPDPLTLDTWHYIEFAFAHANSGAYEVWLDGVSLNTGTGDFANDLTDEPWTLKLRGPLAGEGNYDFDDIYVVSHSSTLQGNNLGPSEVFAYQGQAADGVGDAGLTTNDSTLDTGNWDDAGQTPHTDAAEAVYTASPADGATIFDTDAVSNAGHGKGPSGGAYTVDGTIQGAMWCGFYQRGTGGGSSHVMWYGNSTDTALQSFTMDVISNSVDAMRAVVSEAANAVPESGQLFAQGFGTTGAQNLELHEQWAFLLHTPSAGGVAHLGVVTMSGASTATFKATYGAAGKVAMTGAGSMTAKGGLGHGGVVAMAGAGSMSALGTRGALGKVAMAGASTAAFAPSYTAGGKVAMASNSTATFAGRLGAAGKAAMAGAGSMTAAGRLGAGGKVAMAGSGSMTAIGGIVHGGKVAMAGAATMSAIGQVFKTGVVAFAGAGSMTAAGTKAVTGKVAMAGSAAVSFAGRLGQTGKVTMNSDASVQFAGTRTPGAPSAEPDRGIRKWLP